MTGWTPHWMWAAYELKGLAKDMLGVHAILSRFKLPLPEEQGLMVQSQATGIDPAETAAEWVSQHPDMVKSWMAWPPRLT